MALEENKYKHLEELGGSDFEIVDGEPNIKGWAVKNEQGQKIGEVDELLFDPQSRRVRYLVVDLDGNSFGLDDDRKVLVPIGVASLYNDGDLQDEDTSSELEEIEDFDTDLDPSDDSYDPVDDGDVVIVPATAKQLSQLPAYEKGKVTVDTESNVRQIFEGLGAVGLASGIGADNREDFYSHDHFNEDRFYNRTKVPVIEENLEIGKQEVATGGARITSRIVERPVEETISLREEHVNITRTPVDRPLDASDKTAFQEAEFELTEHTEVPVVNKDARVVEEISFNKEVDEKEETIKETLRNTEVEAERIDPDKTDLS